MPNVWQYPTWNAENLPFPYRVEELSIGKAEHVCIDRVPQVKNKLTSSTCFLQTSDGVVYYYSDNVPVFTAQWYGFKQQTALQPDRRHGLTWTWLLWWGGNVGWATAAIPPMFTHVSISIQQAVVRLGRIGRRPHLGHISVNR